MPDGRLRVVSLARGWMTGCAAASQGETRPAEALGDDDGPRASCTRSPTRSARWSRAAIRR